MKTLAAALTLICCASCAVESNPRWYQTEPSPHQKSDLRWGEEVFVFDPLTTEAATVDDLHRQRKRAVCEVGPAQPSTLLQLCRDKGFDLSLIHI